MYSRANFVIDQLLLLECNINWSNSATLCRLPALKCYIESWGKRYCHHNISLKVLPTMLTCALRASPPYNIHLQTWIVNDPRRVICPIFIVDTDATIQLSNKVELVGLYGKRDRPWDCRCWPPIRSRESKAIYCVITKFIYTVHVHAGCCRQQQWLPQVYESCLFW